MSRVVLTTFGSWGDLFPLLGLGHELARRGHTVVIAATPAAEDLVVAEGFEFCPVGPRFGFEEYRDHVAILDGRLRGVASLFSIVRRIALPHLDDSIADLRRALAGADLLLTHPVQLAGPIAAEAVGVPWATVSVFPGLLPTAHRPPQFVGWQLRGRPARWLNRAAWVAGQLFTQVLFQRAITRARARQGLRRLPNAFITQAASRNGVLVLCSPTYEPPAPDWPAATTCTGFVRFDRPLAFDTAPGLAEFLAAGPPPVVVTLGASSALDPQGFWEAAVAAVDSLGLRAVFLIAQEDHRVGALADRPGVWPFVPLSELLPDAAAVVHHGGFGTVVETIHAGRPSVVVPRAFDQTHHADRLTALGVGRRVRWGDHDATHLSAALRAVLEDPGYRSRAEALAASLAVEDGAARAADAVEKLLQKVKAAKATEIPADPTTTST